MTSAVALPVDFEPHAGVDMRDLFGVLRAMQKEQAQRAQIEEYRRVVNGECEVAIGLINARIAELETNVREIASALLPDGSKHIDLPGMARIQFMDRAPSFTVSDPAVLLEWAVAHERDDLVEHKPTLRKSVAIEAAKNGEALPGVDPVEGKRHMSVRWEGR